MCSIHFVDLKIHYKLDDMAGVQIPLSSCFNKSNDIDEYIVVT